MTTGWKGKHREKNSSSRMCSQVRPNHRTSSHTGRQGWMWTLPAAPLCVLCVQLQPLERREKAVKLKVFILLSLPPARAAPEKPQGCHCFLFLVMCLGGKEDNPIRYSQAGGNGVSSRGLHGAAGSSPCLHHEAEPSLKISR